MRSRANRWSLTTPPRANRSCWWSVVLLLVAREQEVELRLEGVTLGVVVELAEEGVVRRLEDQAGAEPRGEQPRERRLAHADGSFDDQIAWAHVHLCNIGSIANASTASDAAARRPASGHDDRARLERRRGARHLRAIRRDRGSRRRGAAGSARRPPRAASRRTRTTRPAGRQPSRARDRRAERARDEAACRWRRRRPRARARSTCARRRRAGGGRGAAYGPVGSSARNVRSSRRASAAAPRSASASAR